MFDKISFIESETKFASSKVYEPASPEKNLKNHPKPNLFGKNVLTEKETIQIHYGTYLYEILDQHYKQGSIISSYDQFIMRLPKQKTFLVYQELIKYQSPTTGLFPIYTNSKTNIGNVRDTIYCAISIWSLRQCYAKIDSDLGRTYHLGHIAVKAMRGILFCWMKQAHKLEQFKKNQKPENALHSKFNIVTGEEIADLHYCHLQIDCVSLYLLTLSQMTISGLQVKINAD